jgi:hypothetical protein
MRQSRCHDVQVTAEYSITVHEVVAHVSIAANPGFEIRRSSQREWFFAPLYHFESRFSFGMSSFGGADIGGILPNPQWI